VRIGQEIQALPRRLAASERLTRSQNARPLHVVAAALIDAHRRVLIAQRPAGKHLAGAWEFPGGKLEAGEAPAEGLERELREEIGVIIATPRPLMRLTHRYPHGEVLLDVWVVRRYRGRPRGLDGQALRWCDGAALAAADLLPADRPILAALRLPERLRCEITPNYRVVSVRDLKRVRSRSPERRRSGLVGAVCRSGAEASAAAAAGADFVALSPVLPQAELAALCVRVPVPLFARGIALERAWALGATGINALVC
jgi:mutator protein MutT